MDVKAYLPDCGKKDSRPKNPGLRLGFSAQPLVVRRPTEYSDSLLTRRLERQTALQLSPDGIQ